MIGMRRREHLLLFKPVSFNHTWVYVTEVTLMRALDSFRIGTGCQKAQRYKSVGTFCPTSQPLGRGQGLQMSPATNDQLFNQLCLHSVNSIKAPKQQGLESFWVTEHIHALGGWNVSIPRRQGILFFGLLWTSPYVLLHLAVHFY